MEFSPAVLRFVWIVLLLPLPVAADSPLAPYRATYSVERGGDVIGELQQSLHYNGPETLLFESNRFNAGLQAMVEPYQQSERSVWVWQAQTMVPLEYLYQSQRGSDRRLQRLEFDWLRHELRQVEGETRQQRALRPGVIDPLLLQLALRHDLKQGRAEMLDYRVHGFDGETRWRVERFGMEEVDMESRKVPVLKVVIGERQLWLDPAREYLPLLFRFEEGGKTVDIRLLHYRRR